MSDNIKAYWFRKKNNFGDWLNPFLINLISRRKVFYSDKVDDKKYIIIGSILHHADKNTIVWGAGFISKKKVLHTKPLEIRSVRGPLTRNILIDNNISCPKIYGDPALLLSYYYKPEVNKNYEVGIIPHYKDKNKKWVKKQKSKNIKIIDIQGDVKRVIKDILSCNIILSSSLHGIIASDSYGIKSYWIELSTLEKTGLKFKDYSLSVKRRLDRIKINERTSINEIINGLYNYDLEINTKKMLSACPLLFP